MTSDQQKHAQALAEERKANEQLLKDKEAALKLVEEAKEKHKQYEKALDKAREAALASVENFADDWVDAGRCPSCKEIVPRRMLFLCNDERHSICHTCCVRSIWSHANPVVCLHEKHVHETPDKAFRTIMIRIKAKYSGDCPVCRRGGSSVGQDLSFKPVSKAYDHQVYRDYYAMRAMDSIARMGSMDQMPAAALPRPPTDPSHPFNQSKEPTVETARADFYQGLKTFDESVCCPVCAQPFQATFEAPTNALLSNTGAIGKKLLALKNPCDTIVAQGLVEHLLNECPWEAKGDSKDPQDPTNTKTRGIHVSVCRTVKFAKNKDEFCAVMRSAVSSYTAEVMHNGSLLEQAFVATEPEPEVGSPPRRAQRRLPFTEPEPEVKTPPRHTIFTVSAGRARGIRMRFGINHPEADHAALLRDMVEVEPFAPLIVPETPGGSDEDDDDEDEDDEYLPEEERQGFGQDEVNDAAEP